MAPEQGDTNEILITAFEPVPPPQCWRGCSERHHSPFDIYYCSNCGRGLCKGEVFAGGRTNAGELVVPLSHRPPHAGRRKGESSTGLCGPVEFLGECVEKTK